MKLEPRPTTAAITTADLQTRIYVFADDSMMGRQTGREGNRKATAYVARELERLGLEPAGDAGTFFQELPYVVRRYTQGSSLMVNGRRLRWIDDWIAVPGRHASDAAAVAPVIFGGTLGDDERMIDPERAAGRIVVLLPSGAEGSRPPGGRAARVQAAALAERFDRAAAIATVDLDALSPSARAFQNDAAGVLDDARTLQNDPARVVAGARAEGSAPAPSPIMLRISRHAANSLFARPLDGLSPGDSGATAELDVEYVEQPVPEYGRNVIAVLRGRDPVLAGQYVAIGAHHDGVGFTTTALDHDSLRAHNTAELALQISGGELRSLTARDRDRIRVDIDRLRRLRPPRLDSIRNGADDDGSGSMAMLEIAEALSAAPEPPRRSILFIWHTGEESGLSGSRWFVRNPTVPLDSIVAMINLDMIGRGRATEIPGGGDDYLALVGARRLSTELGQVVDHVNQRQPTPFRLDYRFDQPTSWPGYNDIYNRSDHANYARAGIPIAFFFTGLHQDYHEVTDEPQYLDYPHYTAITRYLHDLVSELANRDRRPVVDGS